MKNSCFLTAIVSGPCDAKCHAIFQTWALESDLAYLTVLAEWMNVLAISKQWS